MAKTSKHIVAQPINDRIDDLARTFESEFRIDPFNFENLGRIFGSGNDSTCEAYLDTLLADVSEESQKEHISRQIKKSMSGFGKSLADHLHSQEGLDHTSAPASNAGPMDVFAPATILGYNAKSIMLDVFKSLNHDKREWAIQFELTYAISSNSTSLADRKFLPQAIRDGSLGGMLDPQKVTLMTGAVAPNGYVVDMNGGVGTVVNIGFAKVGTKGNALTESGRDIRDWALAEDIRIDSVLFDSSVAGNVTDPTLWKHQVVAVRSEVKGFGGASVSERNLTVDTFLTLADGSTVEEYFYVTVNRDTGEYRASTSSGGRIKGFSFQIALLNATNQAATLRHGRDIRNARIIANPRQTMSMGLAMDTVMDDFNAIGSGNGADIVKYVSNEFSRILAGVNDIGMENFMIAAIDEAIATPAIVLSSKYLAAPRLGGFCTKEAIDFTLRGVGGDRPLSWMEESGKDTLSNLLIDAEVDTQFDEQSDREWIFVGFQGTVKRFIDVKYTSEVEAEGSTARFGFKKMASYAYSDNLGARCRFIGSTDRRWKNRSSVYGMLRSNTPDVQPTAVYHGWDFRIMKTRDPRQTGIDSISFWTHDVWDLLSLCAVRLDCTNPRNLTSAIINNQVLKTRVVP